MVKTKLSELTMKQREMVKYILDNWEGSEFVEFRRYDDEVRFVFIIPEEDDMDEFFDFTYDATLKFYKRRYDQIRIGFLLTA